jgi:hypothetical protein
VSVSTPEIRSENLHKETMMKRPLQTSLLTCGAILLAMFTGSLASGQATVQYRLEQVPIPEGFYVNDFNN